MANLLTRTEWEKQSDERIKDCDEFAAWLAGEEKFYITDGYKIIGEKYFKPEDLEQENAEAEEITDGTLFFIPASAADLKDN
jgi:hypothetical protein